MSTPVTRPVATTDGGVEGLLRELAPHALAALVRRYGRFDACEDAVQEALLRAAMRWTVEGVPDDPQGWLITVASHRLLDESRGERSRRRRACGGAAATPRPDRPGAPADGEPVGDRDDALSLLFLCCHPVLSAPSQIVLTLRAVGGLTTAQIAAAFLVPEAAMAHRISLAKQSVKASRLPFALPEGPDRAERLRAVLHVLYLIFNEGYTVTAGQKTVGQGLTAPHLSDEAIRLTRWLRRLLPEDGEVAGLLALMLLTDARRPARALPDGSLVPLEEQDRSLWDRDRIAEGAALVRAILSGGPAGPYQVRAAIAAAHDEAEESRATDWPRILALYDLLEQVAPGPAVTLDRAVAVGMVHGPAAGLDLLATLGSDERMAHHHRLLATRAHLLAQSGERAAAAADYREAARRTSSVPQRRYLIARATQLSSNVQ